MVLFSFDCVRETYRPGSCAEVRWLIVAERLGQGPNYLKKVDMAVMLGLMEPVAIYLENLFFWMIMTGWVGHSVVYKLWKRVVNDCGQWLEHGAAYL